MASMDSQRTDALGARASNAGDQYQELWALQRALGLLSPSTGLAAVTVEGVASETTGEDHGVWDGVDCALYYEGKTLETASRVVIEQLKYSTTAPEDDWTVARLASNSKMRGNNSVLRRLADAFRGAKSRMKTGAELRIGLISNQGVASDVFNVVGVLRGREPDPNDRRLPTNIEKFKTALGLSDESYRPF